MTEKKKRIDCFKCAHFFITYDKSFPRGCKALRFKGKEMPSSVVFASSGEDCRMFIPKKPIGGEGAKD